MQLTPHGQSAGRAALFQMATAEGNAVKLTRWTLDLLANRPESLLKLLIRAHEIDVLDRSVSAAFRAGLRIGAANPELADSVYVTDESPVPVIRRGASFVRRFRR